MEWKFSLQLVGHWPKLRQLRKVFSTLCINQVGSQPVPKVSVGGLIWFAQDTGHLLEEETVRLHSNVGKTQTALLVGVLQHGQRESLMPASE